MKNAKVVLVCLFLPVFIFLAGCATTPKLITESFYVPARDPVHVGDVGANATYRY
jgi:starvation-inducible outer membrane lipoprotein